MWTPTALASDLRHYRGRIWRVVEAQHRISTNRLAATLDDQRLLEELVETVKPALPRAARDLHYLLASPFRYGHTVASRFRRAGERPGIFYASEHEATAIAEIAYWRLRFLSRSPGLAPPQSVSEHSSFSVSIQAERCLDLERPPLSRDRTLWMSDDYAPCQALASAARAAAAQAIRSASARDSEHRANVAVLDAAVFAERQPRPGKTWHFKFEDGRLLALAAFPSADCMSFTVKAFGLRVS